MKRIRFSEEQISGMQEAKFGRMDVLEAKRPRSLQEVELVSINNNYAVQASLNPATAEGGHRRFRQDHRSTARHPAPRHS